MPSKKLAAALVALAASTITANAAAIPNPHQDGSSNPMFQTVASWRYHDNCSWSGGRWVVGLGGSRVVACRPIRPSRDYEWHREGGREGWYQSREHHWHNDKW